MLKVYYWDDAANAYQEVSVGSLFTPLSLVAGSLRGQDARITEKLYLRNDELNTQYTNIEASFIDVPSSWKAKLIDQNVEPTEEAFLALPSGNIMTHVAITDLAFHAIWAELIVPQGTAPSVFAGIKIRVNSTREAF